MEGMIVLLVLAVLSMPVLLVVALVSVGNLKRRVGDLEDALAKLRRQVQAGVAPAATQTAAPPAAQSAPPRIDTPPRRDTAPAQPITLREPVATPASVSAAGNAASAASLTTAAASASTAAPQPRIPSPRAPSEPNFIDIAIRTVKRWFTVGNVPVKIGMLVLLAGVAALLKYASDQGWLQVPIALRLAGISAAALAGLVFAWRQRERNRTFALAVQGGAIGVLLLVVFAAFKLYGLLPATAAFALSVVLVAGLGVLAVLQDSRTLAVLGILAGFLAPIWLSTGSGNHVALFLYYALLNAAIFAIAWAKSWRVLNLLGFVFTFGLGIVWGVLDYDPDKYVSTQPFLALFFAFYLLLPVLHARKRPASRGDRIDGCLLFGTPLIAFSLQAALLDGARLPLAFCALGLAAVYALLAWALVRRERYAVLGQAHALLAVGFATLAVPLALSARATACVFALEGAGLVWLGLKQGRRLPRWTGFALQLAAALAFFVGEAAWASDARAVTNATFMSALLIALAGFASAWAYRSAGKAQSATLYYLWGLAWWCGSALHEIDRFVDAIARADVMLAFVALTGSLAAETHRRRPAVALASTTLAAFALAIPLAFVQAEVHQHPFAGNGWWAWLVFALLGVRSLLCLRAGEGRVAAWTQFAWWLLWPTVLSLFASYLAQRFVLAEGWRIALPALPWLAAFALSQLRWSWLAAPLGARFDGYRMPLQIVYAALLGIGWIVALSAAGASAPLPWIPVLNPLDLAQLAVLALLARWLWSTQAPDGIVRLRIALLSTAGFALVTAITLRAVHHWGGVPWSIDMLDTSLAQTSLTVVWSVLGVAGWIAGSRRGQRTLWLAGAVLMAVVLAKLVFVDRQHLGNLLGIGSFIAYGLLCTLVGWFAPAPPRAHDEVAGAAA